MAFLHCPSGRAQLSLLTLFQLSPTVLLVSLPIIEVDATHRCHDVHGMASAVGHSIMCSHLPHVVNEKVPQKLTIEIV